MLARECQESVRTGRCQQVSVSRSASTPVRIGDAMEWIMGWATTRPSPSPCNARIKFGSGLPLAPVVRGAGADRLIDEAIAASGRVAHLHLPCHMPDQSTNRPSGPRRAREEGARRGDGGMRSKAGKRRSVPTNESFGDAKALEEMERVFTSFVHENGHSMPCAPGAREPTTIAVTQSKRHAATL